MKRGREVGTRVSRSENRQSDGKVKVSCSHSQRKDRQREVKAIS